jgi:hypothetical protein
MQKNEGQKALQVYTIVYVDKLSLSFPDRLDWRIGFSFFIVPPA